MSDRDAVNRVNELEESAGTLDLEGARAHYVSALFGWEQSLAEVKRLKVTLAAYQAVVVAAKEYVAAALARDLANPDHVDQTFGRVWDALDSIKAAVAALPENEEQSGPEPPTRAI